MIWPEVEKKYGKELADKMKDSQMLVGITVELYYKCKECGERYYDRSLMIDVRDSNNKCFNCGKDCGCDLYTDIPERDIYLAYKDVTGKPIHPLEWD